LVFSAAVAGIGWAVGSSWHTASHDLRYVDYAVVVLAVVLAGYIIWRRRRPGTLPSHDDSSR
jgi:membrane protein DedA with SNARE-associated domain